jgi:hypothetical protein
MRKLPWVLSMAGLFALAVRSWLGLGVGGVAAVAWFLEYPQRFRAGYRHTIQRLLTPERNPCLKGVHRLEVLPTGIRVTCEMSDTTMPWKRVRDVETTATHTFVELTGECGLVIPRGAVLAGDYDALADALRGQMASSSGVREEPPVAPVD